VTASAFKEEQQEILAAGLDDFVRKPFHAREIYDCLARHLDLRFEYRSASEVKTTPAVLTSEMFSRVPEDLRLSLRDTLQLLDSEKIAEVIKNIENIDVELGNSLNQLCESFDYQTILDALKD
jgi:hypothetical protein